MIERTPIEVALLVVSDRAARGERADETAALLRDALRETPFALVYVDVVPDEREQIAAAIVRRTGDVSLVLTTGGTGLAARDVTPEATRDVVDVEIPGLAEEMRRRSIERTVHAMGSRAIAGAVGSALVVNLPGRPSGAVECFGWIASALPHLIAVRRGPVSDQSHGSSPMS